MFDDNPDVRNAAEESLQRIGDPTVRSSTKREQVTEKSKVVEETSISQNVSSAVAESPVQHDRTQRSQESSAAKAELQDQTLDIDDQKDDVQSGAHAQSAEDQPASDVHGHGKHIGRGSTKTNVTRPAKSHQGSSKPKFVEPQISSEPSIKAAVFGQTGTPENEKQLLQEEQLLRKTVEKLRQQSTEIAAALTAAQNEALWRGEKESKLRDGAETLRRQEHDERKRLEEDAANRRAQEREALAAEQKARTDAETEAHRLAEEESRLWIESARLSQTAAEVARKRNQTETARLEAAEAEERAEAELARKQAQEVHAIAIQKLRDEEERLRRASEEANQLRTGVEEARERAEREAEKLVEAQARMRAAEEARAKSEAERTEVEAALHQRVETEGRRLEEARVLAQQEHARMEEETRRQVEADKRRRAELESAREKAESDHQQHLTREQEILGQIDSLRIADAEARKRIAEAESRKHTAEQAYELVADKVQRVEAEAHATAQEEEQIIARLESARRNVANEAQARAEQEKRIKDEIEMFRRIEAEERPRIEELTLQRTAAEARLQQERDRLAAEEEARAKAEEQLGAVAEYRRQMISQPVAVAPIEDDTIEEMAPVMSSDIGMPPTAAADEPAPASSSGSLNVPPAIASYLHSVDPYKRAAAVSELARSHSADAFSLIAHSFDDHSPHVRNAAARALRKLEPHKTVDLFNRALDEGSEERRRNIGAAIAASGVATEAIDHLGSDNREDTYNALSLLFVMAKTGEVQPLVQAIEEHENDEVCRAAIKLLTLSGKSEIGDAALQRRMTGVVNGRNKSGSTAHNEIPDFRLRIAEVEVKRALNGQQTAEKRHDSTDSHPEDTQS